MDDLEKQAGLSKQASDDAAADEKHEKKEDKVEDDAKKNVSEAKSALGKSEKDFENLKKMNEKEEKKDEKGEKEQTKEAQATSLADQIMQKVASANITTNKDSEMNKQASDAGKALADALLTKLANAGDVATINGIPGGVAPNKNQIDVAQQVAEQDATIKPMPTGDGIRNSGTINQIFDAIVSDALGQGAAAVDQVAGGGVAGNEGAVEAHAVPNQVPDESVEKTAAVVSLVNSGIDFDDAVNMVKAAAEQIEAEEAEQVKQAAFASLVGQGIDFDLAAAMVKSAGKMDAIKGAAGRAVESAKGAAGAAKDWAQREGVRASVGAENVAFGLKNKDKGIALRGVGQLAKNRLVQAGAAAGALGAAAGALGAGGAAYALGREKQAAVSALCEAGVDFESAVDLVQAKSQELYGA
jgi:hypothetical protein